MLSRFHLIPERYGQTDKQTDRFAISISRVSMLTRDKNYSNIKTCCPCYNVSWSSCGGGCRTCSQQHVIYEMLIALEMFPVAK